MSEQKWRCVGCGHIPHAVCFGLNSDGSICRCEGQPEHDVVCPHGRATDIHCCDCRRSGFFPPDDCACQRCCFVCEALPGHCESDGSQ
jgi:hypothetical protein